LFQPLCCSSIHKKPAAACTGAVFFSRLYTTGLRRLFNTFHGQLDATFRVYIGNVYVHDLTFFQVVGDVFHALIADLGDVQQTIFTRQYGNEGTEINDLADFTGVGHAHFDIRSDGFNHAAGNVRCFFASSKDFDFAVVIDVDRRTGFFGDVTDGGATFTDHFTDLVRRDLHGGHGRSVVGQLLTRLGNHFVHLLQNVQTGRAGFFQ